MILDSQPTELSHRLLALLLWVALWSVSPSREYVGQQNTSGSETTIEAKGHHITGPISLPLWALVTVGPGLKDRDTESWLHRVT